MDHRGLCERTAEFARKAGEFARPLLQNSWVRNAAEQLMRAAESVAANYRAAGLARSPAEFVSTIGLVRTESDEAVYWLLNLSDAGLAHLPLLKEARELAKIFAASYRTAKGNLQRQSRKRSIGR